MGKGIFRKFRLIYFLDTAFLVSEKGERPIFRIDFKRLVLLSALLGAIILLLRGCFYAKQKPAATHGSGQNDASIQRVVKVYYDDEKTTLTLPLSDYLAGVVAGEMPVSFHPEALCAQAVAARTYTLHKLAQGGCRTSGCDLCTDSGCCQAFDSVEACRKKWGGNYAQNHAKIAAAVEKTAGEALFYDGTLIEALYHAASGGYTEDSENVFSAARPYLRGVESAVEVGSSHLQDIETFSKKEFVKKVNAAWPKAKLKASRLENQVFIESRYLSGRVERIKLNNVTVSGRELRALFELRSAMFTISFDDKNVIIETKGFGHGVGMSQAGANGMAQAGYDHIEILSHYYTGAEIKQAK